VDRPDSCAGSGRDPGQVAETGRERVHCASNLAASPGSSPRKAPSGRKPNCSQIGASSQKTLPTRDCRSGAAPAANPDFPMEFAGLPWDFERDRGPRPSPKTGSAVHHLVTSFGVKKALMGLLQLPGRASFRGDADGSARSAARGDEPGISRFRVWSGACHRAALRADPLGPSRNDRNLGEASRTHSAKMRSGARLSHCADGKVKE
jgi:hypothetical protein